MGNTKHAHSMVELQTLQRVSANSLFINIFLRFAKLLNILFKCYLGQCNLTLFPCEDVMKVGSGSAWARGHFILYDLHITLIMLFLFCSTTCNSNAGHPHWSANSNDESSYIGTALYWNRDLRWKCGGINFSIPSFCHISVTGGSFQKLSECDEVIW